MSEEAEQKMIFVRRLDDARIQLKKALQVKGLEEGSEETRTPTRLVLLYRNQTRFYIS
jgi:hypothetical protein